MMRFPRLDKVHNNVCNPRFRDDVAEIWTLELRGFESLDELCTASYTVIRNNSESLRGQVCTNR